MMLWLLTTLVATCGQKGPLYLPEDSPELSTNSPELSNNSPELRSNSPQAKRSSLQAAVYPSSVATRYTSR